MSRETESIPQIKRTQATPQYREDSVYHPVIQYVAEKKKEENQDRKRKRAPRKIRRAPDSIKGKIIDLEA